ncbi:2-hydroxyacid dehydrogenase [Bordetella genomosp. 13]|uniref:Glyoxylate/hydroxypyruvate reductase A n=1 Tax=Bordetella genomosp. 13 TaxID=463040 RepID=A0A1W6ZAW7_9BORD|nr:glyoxylate/hydroxypyruvate reductase A [Bordetella genomosp. 13]ARP94536.1 glyoxylate/hydroxypyruvate reductase A [Bordetella genomosp. 13]
MRITINSGGPQALDEWRGHFRDFNPAIEVVGWDAARAHPAGIGYALVWAPEAGRLAALPDLKLVISAGAGVDGILADPLLPPTLPIARMITDSTATVMGDYVLTAALMLMRDVRAMALDQAERRWRTRDNPPALAQVRVGVMGLGQLGAHTAQRLAHVGFDVAGWSRSRAALPGVACFAGQEEFAPFLARTDILVCLLPGTDATRGILGARTFAQLPRGAGIINVGRGSHLVQADLLQALDAGQLKGAVLDVFDTEPLPVESPLWSHPGIVITPHCGATPDRRERARKAVDIIERWERGETLELIYDCQRGY